MCPSPSPSVPAAEVQRLANTCSCPVPGLHSAVRVWARCVKSCSVDEKTEVVFLLCLARCFPAPSRRSPHAAAGAICVDVQLRPRSVLPRTRAEDISKEEGQVPRLVTHRQRLGRFVPSVPAPYYPARAGSREAVCVLRGPAAAPRRVRPTCDGWPGPAAAAAVGPVTTAAWALH